MKTARLPSIVNYSWFSCRHNAIFKDVFREVGMLEVFVTCLSRYAVFLKDKQLLEEEKLKCEKDISPEAGESPKPPERKKRQSRQDSLIKDPNADAEEEELGSLVMEGLTALLNGNVNNCNVFRDCGGAKCVHGMVVHEACRSKALGMLIYAYFFVTCLARNTWN